jgi:hypothetical protein
VTITQTEPTIDDLDEFDLDLQISILPEGTQPVGRHTHWHSCAPCVSITSWANRCC